MKGLLLSSWESSARLPFRGSASRSFPRGKSDISVLNPTKRGRTFIHVRNPECSNRASTFTQQTAASIAILNKFAPTTSPTISRENGALAAARRAITFLSDRYFSEKCEWVKTSQTLARGPLRPKNLRRLQERLKERRFPARRLRPPTSPATASAASPGTSPASASSPNASPPPGQGTGVASPSPGQMANTTPGGSSPVAPSAQTPGAPWPIQTAGLPPMYSAAWHHVHLYAPRSINRDSNMPAYRFLYEQRRIAGERSAEALQLSGPDAPPEGWEVVPTYDAKCVVAYLMGLNQSHSLKDVRSVGAAPATGGATAPAAQGASPAPAAGGSAAAPKK